MTHSTGRDVLLAEYQAWWSIEGYEFVHSSYPQRRRGGCIRLGVACRLVVGSTAMDHQVVFARGGVGGG